VGFEASAVDAPAPGLVEEDAEDGGEKEGSAYCATWMTLIFHQQHIDPPKKKGQNIKQR